MAGARLRGRGDVLARIVAGRSIVTLALLGDPAEWNDVREGVAVSRSADGWTLRGATSRCPSAASPTTASPR